MKMGCDVVDLSRVAGALARDGSIFTGRLLNAWEKGWCHRGDLPVPVKVAACLAVKESLIKALGGRPAGFRWTELGLLPAGPEVPGELAALWRELARETGAGAEKGFYHPCRAYRRNAWAAWGTAGEMVVAVVLLDSPPGELQDNKDFILRGR
ncbi:MAG: 4'-phosphopantetheinyl transferase superfamily protein [Peptococcaceae bacterium]|nr:4'-phosphopantetheinyl transferase superfamily protein [Peptococcaceae bacterium]